MEDGRQRDNLRRIAEALMHRPPRKRGTAEGLLHGAAKNLGWYSSNETATGAIGAGVGAFIDDLIESGSVSHAYGKGKDVGKAQLKEDLTPMFRRRMGKKTPTKYWED